MTAIEQTHIVEAYSFELGKVHATEIRARQLQCLANIDADLCRQVAERLGLAAPDGEPAADVTPSAALSQIVETPGPVAGRKLGVMADDGSDLAAINRLKAAMDKLGVTVLVVAPKGGVLGKGRTPGARRPHRPDDSVDRVRRHHRRRRHRRGPDLKRSLLLQEAYHHCKTVGAWGDGSAVLASAGIPADGPGVIVDEKIGKPFTDTLRKQLGLHRAWERAELVKASPAAGRLTPAARWPASGVAAT